MAMIPHLAFYTLVLNPCFLSSGLGHGKGGPWDPPHAHEMTLKLSSLMIILSHGLNPLVFY